MTHGLYPCPNTGTSGIDVITYYYGYLNVDFKLKFYIFSLNALTLNTLQHPNMHYVAGLILLPREYFKQSKATRNQTA